MERESELEHLLKRERERERERETAGPERQTHRQTETETGRGAGGSGPSPKDEDVSVQKGSFCQNTQQFHNWDSAAFPSEDLMTELLSSHQLA